MDDNYARQAPAVPRRSIGRLSESHRTEHTTTRRESIIDGVQVYCLPPRRKRHQIIEPASPSYLSPEQNRTAMPPHGLDRAGCLMANPKPWLALSLPSPILMLNVDDHVYICSTTSVLATTLRAWAGHAGSRRNTSHVPRRSTTREAIGRSSASAENKSERITPLITACPAMAWLAAV